MSTGMDNGAALGPEARPRLGRLAALLAEQRVPSREAGSWLAGTALCSLLLLGVTGVLLLMHYRPSPAEAYGSLVRIDSAVAFGSIVRGMHRWSADLFLLAVGAYSFCYLVQRRHAGGGGGPWVFTWLFGLVALATAVTGSALPWSRAAHAHARVAAELLAHLPLVGEYLRRLLLGGDYLTGLSLGRAFALHVGVLPGLLLLVGVGYGVAQFGRPRPDELSSVPRAERTIPIHPDFLVRQAALWSGLTLLVVLLATLWPRPAGAEGDLSLPAPVDVGPAWYLEPVHQLLRAAPASMAGLTGATVVVAGIALAWLATLVAPWLDRRGGGLVPALAWLVLVSSVALVAYGSL